MNVIHVYSLTNLLGIVEFYIISAQSNVCNLKISVIAEWESLFVIKKLSIIIYINV